MGRAVPLGAVNRCFELRVAEWISRRSFVPVAGLIHLRQLGVTDFVEPEVIEPIGLDTGFEPTFLLATAIFVEFRPSTDVGEFASLL